MNELIQKLAMQAKLRPALLINHWGTSNALTDSEQQELEQMINFAKLIVEQCLYNMQNCDGDLDFAIWKTKKDFEIKE